MYRKITGGVEGRYDTIGGPTPLPAVLPEGKVKFP